MARRRAPMTTLTASPAWKALAEHQRKLEPVHLRDLFAADPSRGERFACEGVGLHLHFFKNTVTEAPLRLPPPPAESAALRGRIDAMFRGERINSTEDRAVLHVALRAPRGTSIRTDGEDVVPAVHSVLDQMSGFCERVRG